MPTMRTNHLLGIALGAIAFAACSNPSSNPQDGAMGMGDGAMGMGGGVAPDSGGVGGGAGSDVLHTGAGGLGAGGSLASGAGGNLGYDSGLDAVDGGGLAGRGADAAGVGDADAGGTAGRDASGTGGRDASGTGGRTVDAGNGDSATSGGPDGTGVVDGGASATCAPAVTRGGQYFSFAEKFNRYYTDCAWQPSSMVYVSPDGTGKGTSRTDAMSVADALAEVIPGRMVVFTAGSYAGCYELTSDQSGSYDQPIVLVGERKADGSPAVTINCCSSGRKTCINLEAADYVAVDGFELVGGDYGVRSVGADYAADQHQKGVAVLSSLAHDQNKDPFFTGQSDWFVIERCTGHDSGTGDGHGIYLSNGSDWNIARYNELYNTSSSDFQINADPGSTCSDEGIAYDDPECDAVAGTDPTGGRGASDYMLIDSNFFHHSKKQGANFTSVRNSTVKNNIFALPALHGVSFWQETDNPRLGSSNNLVAHNLFITQTNNRQAVQFISNSTSNRFENNVVAAVSISGTTASANPNAPLLDTDSTTTQANTFAHNAWIAGFFDAEDGPVYAPNSTELRRTDFDPTWFAAFPTKLGNDPSGFAPSTTAPWLGQGDLLPEVPLDFTGRVRQAPVDLGPYQH